MDRLIEGRAHDALGRKVVYLVRCYALEGALNAGQVEDIEIVQDDRVGDAQFLETGGSRPAGSVPAAMDFIAFLEEQLRKVGSVLS
jgi:hypothetical protein